MKENYGHSVSWEIHATMWDPSKPLGRGVWGGYSIEKRTTNWSYDAEKWGQEEPPCMHAASCQFKTPTPYKCNTVWTTKSSVVHWYIQTFPGGKVNLQQERIKCYTHDGQIGGGALQFIWVEQNAPLLDHLDTCTVSKLHSQTKELGEPSVWKSAK